MAMNVAQARIIDPILTTVAQGYTNMELTGSVLFPRVGVLVRGGKVVQFGKESFMSYGVRRAPGANTKRVEFAYGNQTYTLFQDAVEGKVPFELMQDASQVPGIDLGTMATNQGMDIVLLAAEVDQAALAVNPANYASSNKIALTSTAKWSDPSSTPGKQMRGYKEAVRAAIGRYPNVLQIGAPAFNALAENPAIKTQFQYTTAESLTEEMLARYFGVQKVSVGKAVSSDDLGNFSDVWGNNAVLAYVPQTVTNVAQPSYGYTYTLEGAPYVEEPYQDRNAKSWIYPVTHERAPVITCAGAGFLIQTPA